MRHTIVPLSQDYWPFFQETSRKIKSEKIKILWAGSVKTDLKLIAETVLILRGFLKTVIALFFL